MDLRIIPRPLAGTVAAIPSKSVAHRYLILASLSDATTEIGCPLLSADIEATIRCVEELGARVARTRLGLRVVGRPVAVRRQILHGRGTLDCGESGSTLRFLLPVVSALGCGATFTGSGRLGERPLSPLYEQLVVHGMRLGEQGSFPLEVSGRLSGGTFVLPGDVSSQFVSGLLMAAPAIGEPVRVFVSEPVESEPYLRLTIQALETFGVPVETDRTEVGGIRYRSYAVEPSGLVAPEWLEVEGDWSNAAFWLAAGATSARGVEVTGLDATSVQGDRSVLAALAMLGARVGRSRRSASVRHEPLRPLKLDVSPIPDLAAPLAAVAAVAPGTTRLTNAGRLRLKESDRLTTVRDAIVACGGSAAIEGDDLVIEGRELTGGEVDAANDHRIAMMAGVLASRSTGPVTVRGADCVAKSYPGFWEDYVRLGGVLEEA